MTERTLQLTPAQRLTVLEHEPGRLVLEARWEPAGMRPPAHLHPGHDERFSVSAGELTVRVGEGEERTLGPGDELAVPRGTVHAMWNASDAPAVARWESTPGARALAFFTAVDAAWREQPDGSSLGAVAAEFADVVRLA